MGRIVKFFYWISGDPPSDSYELKVHAEDGETMPTASEFQQTMAASNARLAGAYLRMWKVSIPARNFEELLKHPLDPSTAILPPEGMDLYLKDPPIFGHISFIVEAVIKGKIGDTMDTTSSKRVQRSSEPENMAGPSGRVYLDTPSTSPPFLSMFKATTKSVEITKPPSVVNNGDRKAVQGNAGTFKFEMAPVSSGSTSRKRALRSGTSQAENTAGPSKRVRLDESSTWSAGTVIPSSSSNGNRITTNGKTNPNRLRCPDCGIRSRTIAARMTHKCRYKSSILVKDKASGKRLGSCYRLPFERNMGCYDKVCEFEAVEVRDILLHIQSVHNNGREVVVHDR